MRARGVVNRSSWTILSVVLALVVLATLALPTMLGASGVQDYGPWRGEYFDNPHLAGNPKLVRTDESINFDWGLGSPDPSIPNERFSVRWTAFIKFEAGTYRFSTYTDDGVRLWINEALVLDQWHVQSAIPYDVYITLSAGYHYIRMEYFENTDRAVAKLSWLRLGEPQPQPPAGWKGEYFANPLLSGAPAVTRVDPEINFDWGSGPPAAGIPADNFSVRWTRTVHFNAGYYTFYAQTDDGVRVWVDGQLIIDRWYDQGATTHSATIYVSQGERNLRVEYYERFGVAKARFWWQATGAPAPTPVPSVSPPATSLPPPGPAEIIVDNLSPGFRKGGLASSWYSANIGYGGHTYWTYNSVYQVYNYATWTPKLPGAGHYDVYAFVPRNYADTRSARYRVFHNGQRNDVWVGQYRHFDQWVKLGTFYFHAGGGEYVYLSDNTHEAYASKRLAFDAIKFVRTGVAPPPATPTPVPTPSYGCALVPVAGFGQVWTTNVTVRNRLGCPLAPEKSVAAAEQSFQHGTMFWFEDTQFIYILYSNGIWQSVVDTWRAGDPEQDPSITPPWGYYQPIRGFGKVWREEPGVRDRVGWATEQERGLTAAKQQFERGMMIWSPTKGVFVVYQDGTWQRF